MKVSVGVAASEASGYVNRQPDTAGRRRRRRRSEHNVPIGIKATSATRDRWDALCNNPRFHHDYQAFEFALEAAEREIKQLDDAQDQTSSDGAITGAGE